MKAEIHPKYNETTITCVCGSVFTTRSTGKDFHVEICSNCHPFFTGKQKLIDTAGRVERFRRKYGMKAAPTLRRPPPRTPRRRPPATSVPDRRAPEAPPPPVPSGTGGFVCRGSPLLERRRS